MAKGPVVLYIDKTGTVKFPKVMDNSLDLLSADEVLKALKDSGV
jgi:hypothetical protein